MLFYFQTVCLKAEKHIKVAGKVNCQKRRAPSLSKSCKYSSLLHQTDPMQSSTSRFEISWLLQTSLISMHRRRCMRLCLRVCTLLLSVVNETEDYRGKYGRFIAIAALFFFFFFPNKNIKSSGKKNPRDLR